MVRANAQSRRWGCLVCLWSLVTVFTVGGGDCAMPDPGSGGSDGGQTGTSIDLNVTKLTVQSTTSRGPAVGDGVLAFNANGGADLAWLSVGQTSASIVPAPSGMSHSDAFQFAGKKLVVRDAFSGSLYVFDTVSENVAATAAAAINMGGAGGPNLWEADGNLLATINATVTTENGPGRRLKLVNIGNVIAFTITPFDNDPGSGNPNAIALDATNGRIVVRTEDTFYIYEVSSPSTAPTQITRNPLNGGGGSSRIQLSGNHVAFFDDNENFTLLDIPMGTFSQPTRNPGRQNRGLAFESDRFAFFARQTSDDGSSISEINRALVGATNDINSLIDPAGTNVNGQDVSDGRVGFGATVGISQNGRFVFVAGETAVGVDENERLFLSMDGGSFLSVVDPADPDGVLRAAGVAVSDNLVAFLITTDLTMFTSNVAVGYATLPPP